MDHPLSQLRAILMFTGLILLAACGSAPSTTTSEPTLGEIVKVDGGSYMDISPEELYPLLENKDFPLINVHIPFEGDLPYTDLSIPYDEIDQNLDMLPADKDAKIMLYCRSDRMSRIAAETLVGLGYTNIWNLDGGMVAWEQAGYPIEGR